MLRQDIFFAFSIEWGRTSLKKSRAKNVPPHPPPIPPPPTPTPPPVPWKIKHFFLNNPIPGARSAAEGGAGGLLTNSSLIFQGAGGEGVGVGGMGAGGERGAVERFMLSIFPNPPVVGFSF